DTSGGHRDLHSFLHDALPIFPVGTVATDGSDAEPGEHLTLQLVGELAHDLGEVDHPGFGDVEGGDSDDVGLDVRPLAPAEALDRSEEHTSELQSRENLVCRLL